MASIWFKPFTVQQLNERGKDTLSDFLSIVFTEITKDSLTAVMPVTQRCKQPAGIVHGGANVTLAETLASTAANIVVDQEKFYCVGLEINANHIRSLQEGRLIAKTWPLHIGRSTQVWHIEIKDAEDRITCISRMTASVISRHT